MSIHNRYPPPKTMVTTPAGTGTGSAYWAARSATSRTSDPTSAVSTSGRPAPPAHQAGDLGAGQRHEADRPAHGGDGGDEDHADGDEAEPGRLRAHAVGGRRVVAELQLAQVRRERAEPRGAEREDDERGQQLGPLHEVERPGAPHRDRHGQLGPGAQQDPAVDGGEHGRDADPDDDEPVALDAAPVGEQVDADGRAEAADEGPSGRRPHPAAEHGDGDDDARVGARGEADDVGRAEWVVGEGLEDGARQRQRGTEADRGDDARGAPAADDRPREAVAGEQGPHDPGRAQRVVAQ